MNLVEFKLAHDDLDRLVREAMSYGPDPRLNERYRASRAHLQSHYREHRDAFGTLWTTVADPKRFPSQHTDPFESLLASPTLDGLLTRDPKQIQRDLDDIQTAFELCGLEPERVT